MGGRANHDRYLWEREYKDNWLDGEVSSPELLGTVTVVLSEIFVSAVNDCAGALLGFLLNANLGFADPACSSAMDCSIAFRN